MHRQVAGEAKQARAAGGIEGGAEGKGVYSEAKGGLLCM